MNDELGERLQEFWRNLKVLKFPPKNFNFFSSVILSNLKFHKIFPNYSTKSLFSSPSPSQLHFFLFIKFLCELFFKFTTPYTYAHILFSLCSLQETFSLYFYFSFPFFDASSWELSTHFTKKKNRILEEWKKDSINLRSLTLWTTCIY